MNLGSIGENHTKIVIFTSMNSNEPLATKKYTPTRRALMVEVSRAVQFT